MSLDQYVLRKVAEEDLVAVRDMCQGVFEGRDKLPAEFTSWLQSEDSHVLGLDYRGTLVLKQRTQL